jgi:hypothetical protein
VDKAALEVVTARSQVWKTVKNRAADVMFWISMIRRYCNCCQHGVWHSGCFGMTHRPFSQRHASSNLGEKGLNKIRKRVRWILFLPVSLHHHPLHAWSASKSCF